MTNLKLETIESIELRKTGNSLSEARWLAIAAAGVLAGTLVLALTSFSGPVCIARTLFLIPCPGCGLTRSMVSIWKGDLLLSARYHPLGLPLFAVCVTGAARGATYSANARFWEGFDRFAGRWKQVRAARAILGLVLAIWIVRLALYGFGVRLFLW